MRSSECPQAAEAGVEGPLQRQPSKLSFGRFLTLGVVLWCLGVGPTVAADSDAVVSWTELRKEAGYLTQSGLLRGGLWKRAASTDDVYYRCTNHTSTLCRQWGSVRVLSRIRRVDDCACEEADGEVCLAWGCAALAHRDSAPCLAGGAACDPFSIGVQCRCTAETGHYCRRWSCEDADDVLDYVCLEEDPSRKYCACWRSVAVLEKEVRVSACTCTVGSASFCRSWKCEERRITRCAAHGGGWCNMKLAVLVGGGGGLLSLLVVWRLYLKFGVTRSRNEPPLAICLFAPFALLLSPFPPCARFFDSCLWHPANDIFLGFLLLCMPWSIGVLVWGGIPAFSMVAPTWLALLLYLIVYALWHSRRIEPEVFYPSAIDTIETGRHGRRQN